LLGHRHAFIYLSPSSLNNPLLEKFSGMNVVIMISPHALNTVNLPELRDNLKRLSEKGIKYGWTLSQSQSEISEFLFDADFIEVETTAFDSNQLKEMYREFHAISKHPKMIASGLKTASEFKVCYHSGFDHYMGPFISSREDWHPAKSDINRLRVIQVLNMIRSGAEFDAIADSLRTESVLTFKLLRYINSPGIGLQQKIGEIPQALLILGRDRFYRWLSLLLFDSNHPDYHERVLNEQVLARARFLEMLAGQGRVPEEGDHLFMTGLFSLLDVMMDQPLTEVLKQVSLPESVVSTLKREPGPMCDALLLVIAVESGTTVEMATAAAQCGLDAKVVTDSMTEALAWAQQASEVGE
jgi:c-di-GMP phosphodiesterase